MATLDPRIDDMHAAKRELLQTMQSGKSYLTSEVVDAANTTLSKRTIYRYLSELEEDGFVKSRKPNQTTTLWTRAD